VVYDAADSMAAARAWWLLRYFGHADVAVLDGGLAAWVGAGLPVQTGEPSRPGAGDFCARPGGMSIVDAAGAAALARQGRLLDARTGERFRGEVEPIDPVAGHIPGARNRPTGLNVEPSGRFRAAGALREGFEAAGVTGDGELGVYCGSGITAAHQVLALELAGYGAALYPGSWSEWISDPGRPVATGA
jgi:thiosulfate/3-mercaptopyruvate sulfurtransferase